MPNTVTEERDLNADPITGEPGSHPVGTGVGAAGGGAAGAVIGGAVGGPVGAVIGGAIGAIAGGAAGHGVAEQIDPTVEDAYWRDHHVTRTYTSDEYDYERDYQPAYRHGWESRTRYTDRNWDDNLETELRDEWSEVKGESRLVWEDAKDAVQDAWHRTDRVQSHYDLDDHYWRNRYESRPYTSDEYDYDTDYRSAYLYGTRAGYRYGDRDWNDQLEGELRENWAEFKGKSRLAWEDAKAAVQDAWQWTKRRFEAGMNEDRHWRDNYTGTDYYDDRYTYDDYRPAYRYGGEARHHYGAQDWNDDVERDLEQGWNRVKGRSRLAWNDAKHATKDAWHRVERAIPGDADRDGR